MEFIKAKCRTNLDNYDCSITKVFAAVPNKGDLVEVLYKGSISYLAVVSVMHIQRGEKPELLIELHNPR